MSGTTVQPGIYKRFWAGLLARALAKTSLHAHISPAESSWLGVSAGIRGLMFNYVIKRREGTAELYIDRRGDSAEATKVIFDRLFLHKEEVETVFGGQLAWLRLDHRRGCRITCRLPLGGWKNAESDWPRIQDAMIDAMTRLNKALVAHIESLKLELVQARK
jgi:hypothetical protein